nr:hypothetical protein GCM10020092_045140 [Actinoplanes digitatis]
MWAPLADPLLQREALICRMAQGRAPRDFAGLYVGDDEIDGLLTSLPGLDGPGAERVEQVRAILAGRIAAARAAFAAELAGPSAFAAVCRSARLPVGEAEVLALLVAVELSPSPAAACRVRAGLGAAAPAHPGRAGQGLPRA